MKKAFSLIEIVQTVVLLGIIAGLSISFFAKFHADDKLFYSTEKMLTEAVQEAQRQACSDSRPICVLDRNAGDPVLANIQAWVDNCAATYAGSQYNEATGYCEITGVGVNNACIAGMRKLQNATVCVGELTCGAGFENLAVPASEALCPPHGTINLRATSPIDVVGGFSPTILCNGLFDLLNHKTQHTSANDPNAVDLHSTCDIATNPTIFSANPALANINNMANVQNIDSSYSMSLSNGAKLYNLGGNFIVATPALSATAAAPAGVNGNYLKVYIKYDRQEDLHTMHADTVTNVANDNNFTANIKNSNIWCVWIKDTGEVYRCARNE